MRDDLCRGDFLSLTLCLNEVSLKKSGEVDFALIISKSEVGELRATSLPESPPLS